jgi:sugar phosphate isomerase/epimerase
MDLERISCCTIPLRDRDPEYAFGVIAKAGFTKVDLLGRMPHFDLSDPAYDFDAVMAAADRFGLRIANIGSYCGGDFVSDDEEAREQALAETKAVLDAAALCGARSIRTRPGLPEDAAMIDRMVPYYQRAAEYAAKKGVYMGIENHGGPISGNPELCAELFHKVGNPYAGILYEPCNLASAGVDYKRGFEVMRDYITHVHIKDAYPIDGKMTRVWLGTGAIDFRWVVASVEGLGYEGDYALEYEIHDEAPETGLAKWLDWFQKT